MSSWHASCTSTTAPTGSLNIAGYKHRQRQAGTYGATFSFAGDKLLPGAVEFYLIN
jgi:hypothetical protein